MYHNFNLLNCALNLREHLYNGLGTVYMLFSKTRSERRKHD